MEIRERQEQFELQRQRNATITKAQPIPQAIFLVKSHNVFPDAVILTSFIFLILGDGKTRTPRAAGATEAKECYNYKSSTNSSFCSH